MALTVARRMRTISAFYVMEILQRAKQLQREGRDIIHMEIGEPDFPTPQAVLQAGERLLQSGDVKYTAAAGLPQLRQAIADYYRQQGLNVDPARIFITPGASGAFLLAFGISLNPGERVLMADPCYPCNDNFVQLFDGRTIFVPTGPDSGYQLTADLIRQYWQQDCCGVVLASPSNPTGTMITPHDLQQAVTTVNDLGGCFYSDEIYHGLTYDETAVSALQFSRDVFVINSFSKYFGMTGWRVGWLVVPELFIDAAEKLAQNIFISTPTHSQYAALASLQPATLAELALRKQEFAKRRDYLYRALSDLGFKIDCKPQGAFYIYADCSAFTDDSLQFAKQLLEAEGVAVTPGRDFGQFRADQHLRFAYTSSIDRMAEAIERIERFIKR
jgi:aspartate/methionine/tyrosine aminotransferase